MTLSALINDISMLTSLDAMDASFVGFHYGRIAMLSILKQVPSLKEEAGVDLSHSIIESPLFSAKIIEIDRDGNIVFLTVSNAPGGRSIRLP